MKNTQRLPYFRYDVYDHRRKVMTVLVVNRSIINQTFEFLGYVKHARKIIINKWQNAAAGNLLRVVKSVFRHEHTCS